MNNLRFSPDEIKEKVAQDCQRRADSARRKGNVALALMREGQAQVLNGTVEAHPFLWTCRCGQESRIATDIQENGQRSRLCTVCGKPPGEAYTISPATARRARVEAATHILADTLHARGHRLTYSTDPPYAGQITHVDGVQLHVAIIQPARGTLPTDRTYIQFGVPAMGMPYGWWGHEPVTGWDWSDIASKIEAYVSAGGVFLNEKETK